MTKPWCVSHGLFTPLKTENHKMTSIYTLFNMHPSSSQITKMATFFSTFLSYYADIKCLIINSKPHTCFMIRRIICDPIMLRHFYGLVIKVLCLTILYRTLPLLYSTLINSIIPFYSPSWLYLAE